MGQHQSQLFVISNQLNYIYIYIIFITYLAGNFG